MSYLIVYQQRAVREYEVAMAWYKERSIQAAENFESAINKKINILKLNHSSYRKTYKEFREIKLDKYPFNIIYFVDEINLKVIISSIYHNKKNPAKKYIKL